MMIRSKTFAGVTVLLLLAFLTATRGRATATATPPCPAHGDHCPAGHDRPCPTH